MNLKDALSSLGWSPELVAMLTEQATTAADEPVDDFSFELELEEVVEEDSTGYIITEAELASAD